MRHLLYILFISTLSIVLAQPSDYIGYFPLDGNANDASSNSNDGSVNGAIASSDRFYRSSNAMLFDGTNDEITIPGDFSNSEFSVSIWVKFNTNGSSHEIFSYRTDDGGGYRLFKRSSDDRVALGVATDVLSTGVSTSDNPITDFNWHHVVGIRESGVAKLYIDGVLQTNTTNASLDFTSSPSLTLGNLGGSNFLDGSIDELRIFDRALSANEVSQLFEDAPSVPMITSFSPINGEVGTVVTITGSNFSTTPSENTVFFGSVEATVSTSSSSELTVSVPSGSSYNLISVERYGLHGYSPLPFYTTFDSDGLTDGSFDTNQDFTTGTFPIAAENVDLDGDGLTDLVVTNYSSNTVSVFRNTSTNGNISFATKSDFATATSPRSVRWGDFDRDGKFDLAVACSGSDVISVFRNTSSGAGNINFGTREDFTTGVEPLQITLNDFDQNGKIDIAFVNQQDNNISIIRNTSTGSGDINFASKVDFATATQPFGLSSGDLNGDGYPDIAASNRSSSSVSIFENTSTGIGNISFSAKSDFSTGANPRTSIMGDLDGDGKLDLVVTNTDGGTVSLFRNTSTIGGSISFATRMDISTGSTPWTTELNDLDGDGKIDFVATNGGSNTVSMHRNMSEIGSLSFATKIDLSSTDGLYTTSGDYNNDGQADLATTNGSAISVFKNVIPYSFITTWQTTTDNESISIPTFTGETYNYIIDWGDGTVENITTDASPSHTYANAGTHTVAISGTFPRIYFNNGAEGQMKDKILTVEQWGNIQWSSMAGTFHGCQNLQVSSLAGVPNLSNVTDMSYMFTNCSSFNTNIDSWDVSNVTSMDRTFNFATSFNQPLNSWNVSNVLSLWGIFDDAHAFNQPLDNWNVSNVSAMAFSFRHTYAFNQDLSSWDVSGVQNMWGMFDGASIMNYDLSGWDVSSVTSMLEMFVNASAFDQNLSSWDISNITDAAVMFNNSGMSTDNYDATLRGWATLDAGETQIPTGITLGATGLTYCGSESARDELINTYTWTISGDSKLCTLTDGRVAYYPFNNNANDESGNGNDGTFPNGPITYTEDRFGNASSAASFDGIDDIILGSTSTFPIGNAPRTLTGWAKAAHELDPHMIIQYGTNTENNAAGIGYVSLGGDEYHAWFNGSFADVITDDPVDSTWQFITATYDGTDLNLYVNSQLVKTAQLSLDTDAGTNFAIGRHIGGGFSEGLVDDVKVYNRVLSESELIAEYQAGGWDVTNINTFSFSEQTSEATIDTAANTIKIEVSADTDVTSLVAIFSLSPGATTNIGATSQESGVTSNDFSNPVTYSVSGNGGVSEEWTVTVIKDGLVAYYPFNNNANDESGNGKDGTLGGGGTAINFPTLTTDRFGNANSAYSFDGTDDYILAPAQQFSAVNDPFTLVTWVNWDGDASSQTQILSWWDAGSAGGAFTFLGIGQTTGIIMLGDTWFDTGVILPANEWTQIVASFDGSVAKIYLNGELAATEIGRTYDLSVGNLYVGRQGTVNDEYFGGPIDDIRIYNRVLGDSEITDLFIENNWLQSSASSFITTWQTTTDNESINIPIGLDGETYNYTVDWGDGTVETGFISDANHTYASAGTYAVAITGTYPRIYFNNGDDGQMKDKILTVEQWGDIQWSSMERAFYGCSNLNSNASDIPDLSLVTSLGHMFQEANSFNGQIGNWDVSTVTDFIYMFSGAESFNQDISQWDVSNAVTMSIMFRAATSFNQDISTWDVSNVDQMYLMFAHAFAFNQDLSNWNVSNVSNMGEMFIEASSFNQDLSQWDISNLSLADQMFNNSGMSTDNYDATLVGWATLNSGETQIPSDITLGAIGLTYCGSTSARAELINTHNWTISGDSELCTIDDGLIAYYLFNGNSNDESDYGNNGTNNGPTPTPDRFGNAGAAYTFDGTNDISVGSLNGHPYGEVSVSYMAWIRPSVVNAEHNIVNVGPGQVNNRSSLNISGNFLKYGGSANDYVTGFTPYLNEWSHVAVVKSGVDLEFYINGEFLEAGTLQAGQNLTSFELSIGSDNGVSFFNGDLDDIRIYNRPLTESEILEIYESERVIGSESNISEFTIAGQVSSEIIDTESKIIVVMPNGTDLTSLKPNITYSDGATISPDTTLAQDFTNSITYTVTSEDTNSVTVWEVFVYAQPVVADGLIAYYPFNFGTAEDESGNKKDGIISGPLPTNDRLEKTMSAFNFDGLDDAISISEQILLDNALTITAWIKPELAFAEQEQLVIIADRNGADNLEFSITNGSLTMYKSSNSGGVISDNFPTNLNNKFVFVAFTYAVGSTAKLFLNGEVMDSENNSISGAYSNELTGNTTIGVGNGTDDWFKGVIDEVRIYNRQLSEAEIFEIYDSEKVFSSEALITSFTIPNQIGETSIDNDAETIEVVMPAGTDIAGLTPTIEVSQGATVSPESALAQDFTNPVTYTVTAENGSATKPYVVSVTTLNQGLIAYYPMDGNSTDQSGNGFDMSPQGNPVLVVDRFGESELSYELDGTDDRFESLAFGIPDQWTVSLWINPFIEGRNLVTQHDNDPVETTVAFQFGLESDLGLSLTSEGEFGTVASASSDPNIVTLNEWQHVAVSYDGTSVRFYKDGQLINQVTTSRDFEDITTLNIPVTIGALATGAGAFAGQIDEVRIYNGALTDQQMEAVYVSEAPVETDTEILSYSFPEQTVPATIGDGTVIIEVANGTDLTNLIASFTLSERANATISGTSQVSGVTANNFVNPVTYVVTAADGITTQNWVVTVFEASITATEILAFGFDEETGPATIGDGTVAIEVTFGTDLSDLVATFNLSTGATAEVGGVTQESGVTSNDFSSAVTYTVTAEDNVTTQDWSINVSLAANDSTDIKSFVIDGTEGEINATDHTVSIAMPPGTDLSFLIPTIEVSTNAIIGPASGSGQNFNNPVTYTVAAEDLSTQEWIVTATVLSIPPESLFLSNSTITAGPVGKIVGDIGIVDEDNTINDYDLTITAGGENFEITSNQLVTKVALTAGSYVVTIQAGGPATIQETFTISVIDASEIQNAFIQIINSLGRDASNYRIIGFPVASAGIGDLFTSPGVSDLGVEGTWRLLNYSGGNSRDLGSSSQLSAGVGYWFITTLAPEVIIPDNESPASLNSKGEFELSLNAGWNLIGNPFNASWNWEDVINYNIQKGYIQSEDVKADFWKWKPGASVQVGYINERDLKVFDGGWVDASAALTLFIPTPEVLNSGGRIARTDKSKGYFNDLSDWEIVIDVIGNKYFSSVSGVSFNADATIGYDEIDRTTPPSIDSSIRMELLDKKSGTAINRVPYTNSHTWNFNLDANDGATITLKWDQNLVNSIGSPLYMIVPEEGQIVDMRTATEIKTSSKTTHVQVHYGSNPPLPDMVNVLAAYPNPSAEDVFVRVMAHESLVDGEVVIQLYDHQGKLVKNIDGLSIISNGTEFKLTLNDLATGIYVLQVLIDDQKSKNIKIQKR